MTRQPKNNRRDFLKIAALILSSYGISPLMRRDLYRRLQLLSFPELSAQTAPNTVDFYLDISLRMAVCMGELFPSPGFADPNANVRRGQTQRNNVLLSEVGGRRIYFTDAAHDNGGESLQQFSSNIAFLECVRDTEADHSDVTWSLKIGGERPQHGGVIPTGAPTWIPMFAKLRATSANSPSTPGMIRGMGGTAEVYSGLPTLTQLTGPETLRSLLPVIQPKIGRTEAQEIGKAIRAINNLQTDQRMKLRFANAEDARTSSAQGLEILGKDPTDVFSLEFNEASKNEFGAQERLEGYLFGEDLLLAYIGFKHNLVGSVALHMHLNHTHYLDDLAFRPVVNDPKARASTTTIGLQYKNFSRKLGMFIKKLKTTPHPFRPGKTIFDHALITMSSEGGRGLDYNGDEMFGWRDNERQSIVLIGGNVRGGYYGDVVYTATGHRYIQGFDPNSGTLLGAGSSVEPASVYKTVCDMLGIPPSMYQDRMPAGEFGKAVLSILKKT